MKNTEKIIQSGDSVQRSVTSAAAAQEIDRILAELGKLYIQRLKALRLGLPYEIQMISQQIVVLKTKLAQL